MNVKRLQTCLSKAGYKCTVDGILGVKTVEAVKTFQIHTKLVVDGLFGKESLKTLKAKLK